jgi:Holliday junction DNA helicase RuvA
VQALVALGYGSTEALRAVKQVDTGEAMEVEEVLKLALKHMSL